MKRKGFIKKALVYTVIGATIAGNTMPAFAYTNSVAGVNETQDVSKDESAECEVYAQLGTSFRVIIPKKITLSGSTKTGSYTVDVEGDIGGTDTVKVVPEKSFTLTSTGLASQTAKVSQDKTAWSWNEILADSKTIGNGAIAAGGITAGTWNGSFWFNISLKENSSLITVEAKNESGEDLNASASEITGTEKNTLLDKLVDSGLIDSVDEVDALIEVESDEFSGMAETTFNVSSIANEGDKIAILHFNEETNEWEYVSTETVNSEGKITADFSSYSPVAFVKVNESGEVNDITKQAGLYDADDNLLCTWEESGIDAEKNYIYPSYKTSPTSGYYVLTNNYPTATKIVIPDSISSIGSEAFSECKNLTSVTIGSGVTSIDVCAFYLCESLTSVTIPDSVTSIGNNAFQKCSSLTSVIIPDSVTSIGDAAFYHNDNLTSITIPNSVTSIGNNAFYECTSLTSVTIPDSVTSIGNRAFEYCTSLTSINVNTNNSNYCSIDGVLFNKNKTTLIAYPAGKTTTSYTIPSSVTSIEDYAFYHNDNLTSITIPNSVTSIGSDAFSWCESLTSATFKTTSGWYVGRSAGTKTTALSSSDLANTSTAATFLKETYKYNYWTR